MTSALVRRTNDFVPAAYNSLPSVEEADAIVSKKEALVRVAEELAPIFYKHNMNKICGISLLHSHWPVNADEIPEQVHEVFRGENALVTKAIKRSAHESEPSSWMLRRGAAGEYEVSVFEFSLDPVARQSRAEAEMNGAFFEEAWLKLIELQLDDVFGICILPRQTLSDDPLAELFETSTDERSSIVLARRPNEANRASYIQTCWEFSEELSLDEKKPNGRYQCEKRSSCKADKPLIGPPGHITRSVHEHVDVN